MKVLNLSAGCECAGTLGIGYRGENDRTEVRFDFSAWAEEFGAPGAVELFVRRQGDTDAYPVALTIDGSEAVWTVSSVDTAVEGLGEAEFVWLLNGVVAKTAVWGTYVAPDIGQPTDEPPDPYESWMEALGEMAAGTLINAQRAETAQTGAEAAEAAAEAAQAAAETAQGSAEDAQAAAEAAQRKAESAQDAAEAAQAAAETAQGIAQSSAQSAAADAASAQTSATAAAASESAAEAAQEAAEASAASANSSAEAAAQSSTAAAASAGAAAASETAADTSATAAAASESAAEAAQEAAEASAASANSSAEAAAQSSTAAAASAGAAAASETAAGASATAAAASESAAEAAQEAAEAAQAAAEAVLESIPEDYSAMSADVAELKSDRDQLEGIDTALNGDNIITVTDFSGTKAVNGATAAYADGKLVMYGTCAGLRRYVCLGGQSFVATTGTNFSQTLRPGKYRVHISATGSYTGTNRLAATANTFASGVKYFSDGDVIDTDVGLMVGYQVNGNADFGTSQAPTYIDIKIECFEAKAGAREHEMLNGAFLSASTKETANALTWEMGSIASVTGEDLSSSERIRTVGFFDVTDAVALRAGTGYEFLLYAYDRVTGDYVGNLKNDGVFDKTTTRLLYATAYYYLEPQLKYRAILRNADGSTAIEPSAGTNLLFVSARIDETLTQQGQAADAKATGDAVAALQSDISRVSGVTPRGLPEGFTEQFAIQTPGSTWIDTGISWSKSTSTSYPRIVIDVLGTGGCAFGSRRTTTRRVEGGPGADWYYGTTRVSGGETLAWLGKRCVCDLSDTRFMLNGEQIGDSYTVGSTVGSDDTIVLFGSRAHVGQTGITDEYAAAGTRIFSARIYKAVSGVETLVFDGVPCIRDADGEVGFYDLIGGAFHGAVTGTPEAIAFPDLVELETKTDTLTAALDEKQDALIDVGLDWGEVYGTATRPYGFTVGYWSHATGGAQSSSTNSMRTIQGRPYVAADGDRSMTVTVPDGYRVQITEYTPAGAFVTAHGDYGSSGSAIAGCTLTAGNKYHVTIGGFDGDSPDYINDTFLATVVGTVRRTLIAWEKEQDARIAALEASAARGLVSLSDIEDFAEDGVYTQSFTLKLPFDGNNANQIFSCCAKYERAEGVTAWPTIYFNTSATNDLNRTCSYVLGGNGEVRLQEWRVVRWPGDATQYSVVVTIPEGVTVTITDFRSRYDDSVNRIDSGIVMYGHQRMPMTPFDTVQSALLAAKAGHTHFVEIPKRCSDGVWIFYHDDSLHYDDTRIRQADGSRLPSTYNGTPWSNISYADEASKWDWGISTNARFAGTGPMRMETFFEICAKTGMKPALSVHPRPSAAEFGEIRTMAQRYGVLGNLTLKGSVDAIPNAMWPVFGSDIYAYVIDVSSGYQTAATVNSAITALNGMTGCTAKRVIELFESTAYLAYFNSDTSKRHEPFEAIAAAGYTCSIAAQLGEYSPTTSGSSVIIPASDMEWWCNNHGVTEFTTEYNYSVGLNW